MTNIYLNENGNRIFQPFIQGDNRGYSPYINKDSQAELSDSYKSSTQAEPKRHNKKVIMLETIGVVGTLGGLAFAIRKSQNISRKFSEWASLAESKYSNNKHAHKIFTKIASGLDKTSKIISNLAPIKDYSLHVALGKTEFTKAIRNKITGFFTAENKGSVESSLKRSRDSYNEVVAALESARIKSKLKGNEHLIKNQAKFAELESVLDQALATPKFLLSYHFELTHAGMMEDMQHLDAEMSMKQLLSTDSLQGFVPAEILESRRAAYVKRIFADKNLTSCSFQDIASYAKDRLLNVHSLIYSVKDPQTQQNLRKSAVNLDSSFKKYIQDSVDKEKRDDILVSVKENLATFRVQVDLLPESKLKEKLLMHLDEYDDLFKEHKSGLIQRLRVLAGEAWGDNSPFDVEVKKKADQHIKDLNKSTRSLINMFDKERDITIGSGAGDIAGLLLPVAGYAWELKKDDTADKRIGTSLELGVPILGSSAFYLYAQRMQYNGFRALVASFGVGVLLNLAGSSMFKKYKSFRQEQDKKIEKLNKVSA